MTLRRGALYLLLALGLGCSVEKSTEDGAPGGGQEPTPGADGAGDGGAGDGTLPGDADGGGEDGACPKTTVTFEAIQGSLGSCAECHSGYNTYATAKAKFPNFLSRVKLKADRATKNDPRGMPKGGTPEEAGAILKGLQDWQKGGFKQQSDCEPQGGTGSGRPKLSFADFESRLTVDGSSITARGDDPKEYRYLTTANEAYTGTAEELIAALDLAAAKAVNSVSTERSVRKLDEVEPGIWRFELDDFGLSEADWVAIENAELLDLESFSAEGVALKAKFGTRKPWMLVDSFVDTVFRNSSIYYSLTDAPATAPELFDKIGADYADDIEELEAIFAGTSISPLSPNPRLVVFHDSRDGVLSTTYDTGILDQDEESLTRNPLLPDAGGVRNFRFQAGEIIYQLPNGMNGFYLAASTITVDGNNAFVSAALDARQDAAPQDVVRDWLNPVTSEIRNAISCFRCHPAGLLPIEDEIAAACRNSGSQLQGDKDFCAKLYKPQRAIDAKIAEANELHNAALKALGIDPAAPDEPITVSSDRFLTPYTVAKLASKLWLSTDATIDCIRGSAEGLQRFGPLLSSGASSKVAFDEVRRGVAALKQDCRIFQDPL